MKTVPLSDADIQIIALQRIAKFNRIGTSDLIPIIVRELRESQEQEEVPSNTTILKPFSAVSDQEYADLEQRCREALAEIYFVESWILCIKAEGPEYDVTREDFFKRIEIFVSITHRGRFFLEHRYNPSSKHKGSSATKRKAKSPSTDTLHSRVTTRERSIRKPSTSETANERIVEAIAGRRGQQDFRQRLIDTYDHCLVTGEQAPAVLEAAHIRPYSGEGTFDTSNGLILRSDIHTLFDLGYITIDTSDMSICITSPLAGTTYMQYHGERLRFPSGTDRIPDREALDEHRAKAPFPAVQQATGSLK